MPCFTQPIHEHGDPSRPGPYPHRGGGRRETTRVGITSARPGTPAKQVFAQMRELAPKLRAIPTVRAVSVEPGLGAWQGGSEPTWVVSYIGNGEATKLLAQLGKAYNQDAVLMLKGCRGTGCSPAVEFVFDRGISGKTRDAIHTLLGEHGMGGWTWYKRRGKAVLRMVSVPQWGGEAAQHLAATRQLSTVLRRQGLGHAVRQKAVTVTVLEREGEHSYDRVLGRTRAA